MTQMLQEQPIIPKGEGEGRGNLASDLHCMQLKICHKCCDYFQLSAAVSSFFS